MVTIEDIRNLLRKEIMYFDQTMIMTMTMVLMGFM